MVPDAPDPVEASEPGATDRQEAVASSDRPEDALSGGVGLERNVHGSTSADSSSEPMSDDAHLDDPNPIEPLEASGTGEPLPEIADPSPTGG